MKKIFLLLVYFGFVVFSYAQKSVTIHGPYEPNGKYVENGLLNFHLTMKIIGDSAMLQVMSKENASDTMTMLSNQVQSKISIITGKVNNDSTFNISIKSGILMHNRLHLTTNKPQRSKQYQCMDMRSKLKCLTLIVFE